MSDRQAHWRYTRLLTVILLIVWVVVTFVVNWYARELNETTFLGFPLGFYMAAQGSLFIYLLLVGVYSWTMRRLDRKFGVDDEGY